MRVDLIVEDSAHELFLRPMIYRLGNERGISIVINTISAIGGRPRVLSTARTFAATSAVLGEGIPDALVIATDGNCVGFNARRNELGDAIPDHLSAFVTMAIPDPHIERWLLADPVAFQTAVGIGVQAPQRKCDRAFYKNFLSKSVADAGHSSTLGGIEFSKDIVSEMDIDRACKNDDSLNHFVRSFRGATARFRGPQ